MMLGRLRREWNQTSHLLAAILNSQPGRKQAVQPHQMNPYHEPAPIVLDDLFAFEFDPSC